MTFKTWKAVGDYLNQGWIILYEGRAYRQQRLLYGGLGNILFLNSYGNWDSTFCKSIDQWRDGRELSKVKRYGFQE